MMNFLAIGTKIISWLLDPKNRNILIFIGIGIIFAVFFQQCNQISNLKAEVAEKEEETTRIENNYLADLDSISQSYNEKTGEFTATIRAYQLTVEDLNGKYKDLFGEFKEWKKKPPLTVIEKEFYITEKITGIGVESSEVDSTGAGTFTFKSDTTFSEGNSRTVSGTFPYKFQLLSKSDSSILDYQLQPFFLNTVTGLGNIELKQKMKIFTGLNRDKKTGEVSTWVKTEYPGIEFTVLKGASVEDDQATKAALVGARKEWGLGGTFGVGGVYNPLTQEVGPGIFVGVSLNYTPKKLQFGK